MEDTLTSESVKTSPRVLAFLGDARRGLKLLAISMLFALAAWKSYDLYIGTRNLYGDWVFLRDLRIQAIQRTKIQQQVQQMQPPLPQGQVK